jgi:hypothetical protein
VGSIISRSRSLAPNPWAAFETTVNCQSFIRIY